MCHLVASWLNFHPDILHSLLPLRVNILVRLSVVHVNRHPVWIYSGKFLFLVDDGLHGVNTSNRIRRSTVQDDLTTPQIRRAEHFSHRGTHFVGTQAPRCKIHCSCHATRSFLIICARCRFVFTRPTFQERRTDAGTGLRSLVPDCPVVVAGDTHPNIRLYHLLSPPRFFTVTYLHRLGPSVSSPDPCVLCGVFMVMCCRTLFGYRGDFVVCRVCKPNLFPSESSPASPLP